MQEVKFSLPDGPAPIKRLRACSAFQQPAQFENLFRDFRVDQVFPGARCHARSAGGALRLGGLTPVIPRVETRLAACWNPAHRFVSGQAFRHAEGAFRMKPPSGAELLAGRTRFRVSQAIFVGLLISFHFLFLMLPLCLLGKPRLDFIAVQKKRSTRVSAISRSLSFL